MKLPQLIIIALLSCLVAFATVKFTAPNANGSAAAKESVYARVMKSKTLRCAYAIYPPTLMRDSNTGQLSGIFHDIMEEVARLNGLKVDWAEEVDYGNIIEGLKTGRYDAFCAAIWPGPERAQQALFTVPVDYSAVGIYVKTNDNRFDGDAAKLNDAQYKISVQDGDINDSIAKEDFPAAQRVSIPQMGQSSLMFLEVINGKTDAMFAEQAFANEYLKKNPGTLKNIADAPMRLFPNVYMIGAGEIQLKVMLDTALQELVWRGYVHRLLEKYGVQNDFLEAAPPYQKL